MILYPTETVYALGVAGFGVAERAKLFQLKGRSEEKQVSLLVRDMADVERWAYVPKVAAEIAKQFLPGPVTLVLRGRDCVPPAALASDGTLSFRISSDPAAQQLIADFMSSNDQPLTCTSANVSGQKTLPTPADILEQFSERTSDISRVIDDGPRRGASSTVVRVVGDAVSIIRAGAIAEADICAVIE